MAWEPWLRMDSIKDKPENKEVSSEQHKAVVIPTGEWRMKVGDVVLDNENYKEVDDEDTLSNG